jgi:ketosteroid isomerase-like protein
MHRALSLLLVLAGSTALADAAEEVRQSEVAFAKAFADRDQEAFFRFVADDATFLDARNTLAGKPAVRKAWAGLFAVKTAPFSWRPERVVTNAAGTLGLSTGPVHDRDGKHVGNYSSVWMKQADGTWKVVFDGPGSPPPCPAAAPKQAAPATP